MGNKMLASQLRITQTLKQLNFRHLSTVQDSGQVCNLGV